MPGVSYCRPLGTLLLYLCYVFRVLINSLVCWFSIEISHVHKDILPQDAQSVSNLIWYRADLKGDAPLRNLLQNPRVPQQSVAMADPCCVQQHSIYQVFICQLRPCCGNHRTSTGNQRERKCFSLRWIREEVMQWFCCPQPDGEVSEVTSLRCPKSLVRGVPSH